MGGAAVTGPFTCVAEQIDGDDVRLRRTNVWEEEPPTGGAFGIPKIVRIPRRLRYKMFEYTVGE